MKVIRKKINNINIDDNQKEEENVTDTKENDKWNNIEETEVSEKIDENEELEIYNSPKPYSHCYSYNITNLSNNREDLGAGFRSRLKNLNSQPSTSSYSSYTNHNINPHPSYNNSSYNKESTTTTTSTTTINHIPSIKIKDDDIKILNNNNSKDSSSTNSKSTQESSIPNSTTSSNKPQPTPTQSNNINNTNKDHVTDNSTDNSHNEPSTSSAAAGKQKATNEEDEEEKNRHMFECNICLDTASDPVVTMCGHFYCWPCIAMWLERSNECPVCKSGISKEKIIPVYARGAERKDPREKDIPHRPAGHREEPEPRRRSPFNFQTSFSTFGLFPFPGFSFTFSNGGAQPGFNQGGFFNPFNLGPNFPQPDTERRTGQGQNGQGGDPNDYQNYILTAFLFFIIFSVLSSILFNF